MLQFRFLALNKLILTMVLLASDQIFSKVIISEGGHLEDFHSNLSSDLGKKNC